MIFSRNSGSGGRHAAQEPRRSGRSRRSGSGDSAVERTADTAFGRVDDVDQFGDQPEFGPFDVSEAPDADRIDLGSLKIPTVDGVEVQVQANADGAVQQIVLSNGDSVLQLAAFAAPRNEGIWDEVRDRIRKQLRADGVDVKEVDGDYGAELRARVRTDQGSTDIRFIGVDGPRWMLRAVYQGRAATEPAAAGALQECLRGVVVDRGRDAMPAEDALPLRLPREIAEQAKAAAAVEAHEAGVHSTNGHPHDHGHLSRGGAEPSHPTADSADEQHRPSPRPRRPE